MRYWPLTAVIESIHMPQQYAAEYRTMMAGRKQVSREAFHVGFHVANSMPSLTLERLVFQYNTDTPDRRLYLDYPETADWLALERGGVYQLDSGYQFLFVDALH